MRIATLAVALTALGGPALSEPSPSAKLAADYAARLAHGQACGWLTPAQRTAIRLNADEQVANALAARGEPGRAETQAALDAALKTEKSCTADDKISIQGYARGVETEWVIRAVALLEAEAKQPHGADFSTASKYGPALRAGFEAAPSTGGKDFQKRVRDTQAEGALRRMCPERKAVRWPSGQRPCPVLAADDAKYLPGSRVFVEGVEAFAVLYAPPTGASAPKAAAFKVDAKHPLARLNGQPLWQVYNDCSWAQFDAYDVVNQRIEAAKSRPKPADLWSAEALEAEAADLEAFNEASGYIQRGQALTAKAIDAYAAQTGKPRAEVEKFVKDAKATMKLNAAQCQALR